MIVLKYECKDKGNEHGKGVRRSRVLKEKKWEILEGKKKRETDSGGLGNHSSGP